MQFLCWIFRTAAALAAATCLAADPSADALGILSRRCLGCHGPKLRSSGLDLSSKASALRGGTKGPALRPGASADSLLMQRVELAQMPPTGVLASAEREALRLWIDASPEVPEDDWYKDFGSFKMAI